MSDKIEDGDFVLVDFTGKRSSDGHIFDTTDEKVAQAAGLKRQMAYKPTLIVVGQKQVIAGFEEALRGMKLGESKSVSIPPEKAFGQRNPKKLFVLPLREFQKRDVNPYPGLVVELDNSTAVVKSVGSGRVTVDTNHDLAGETLNYEIKAVSKIESAEERLSALIDAQGLKPAQVKFKGDGAEIIFADGQPKDATYFISKTALVGRIKLLLHEVKSLKIVEEYAMSEGKPKEEKKVEKPEAKEEKETKAGKSEAKKQASF